MFFLKKIFQLRDHSNPNAEKPFLEHLEDLRVCITRIVLTLGIATVACFIFRNELMDIIRRPVTQVWERGEAKSLQDTGIPLEQWERAKSIADASNRLQPEERETFFAQFENSLEILENVRAVNIYRAAITLDGEKAQKKYVEELASVEAALKEKVLALLEGRPNSKADARGKLVLMQALKPTEGFMLSIKLAFFAGIVVSFPFLLFFLLQFVLPGMHEAERKALWPAMVIGFGLFLSGVFFSYFIVLPKVLEFFHEYSSEMMIENEWRIGYYISFATQFTLIFGLSFELPVLVMTLVKLGILNSEMMRRTRAYAILSIFVVAAIITPTPDAFTLCLLAGPMVILYEICIWLAVLLERKTRRREEEEEKERMARLLARKERRDTLGGDDDDSGTEHGDDPHHPGPDDGTGPDGEGPAAGPAHGHGEDHDHGHGYDHDYHDHDYHHETGEYDHHHETGEYDHHHETDHQHLHEGEADEPSHGGLGFGDDGHTGAEEEAAPEEQDDLSEPRQQDFDFHEEFDPALTEEGEQEDVSDPWPEEGEEEESLDPHHPPEDIPEEERNRGDDDPYKRDQD